MMLKSIIVIISQFAFYTTSLELISNISSGKDANILKKSIYISLLFLVIESLVTYYIIFDYDKSRGIKVVASCIVVYLLMIFIYMIKANKNKK